MGYLTNETDPVPLVLDLRIVHDRFDSSYDPTLNGRLHYNDMDKSLNETVTDKIRKYRADYNNNPPNVVTFMPVIAGTTGRLHGEFIRLLFLQTHRETDLLFAVSGVQFAHSTSGQLKSKNGQQTSRLLTSSLSLGVPVPRPTQCIRGA